MGESVVERATAAEKSRNERGTEREDGSKRRNRPDDRLPQRQTRVEIRRLVRDFIRRRDDTNTRGHLADGLAACRGKHQQVSAIEQKEKCRERQYRKHAGLIERQPTHL